MARAAFSDGSRWVDRRESTGEGPSLRRVGKSAGFAGKKAVLGAAARTIGPDLKLSNDTRNRRLRAGFDVRGASGVDINLRPKGWWVLADSGRKRSGFIMSPFGAVLTPEGPRAWSGFDPSRGTGVRQKAQKDAEQAVPVAAAQAFSRELGRVVRG